jgi:hypothetical protein
VVQLKVVAEGSVFEIVQSGKRFGNFPFGPPDRWLEGDLLMPNDEERRQAAVATIAAPSSPDRYPPSPAHGMVCSPAHPIGPSLRSARIQGWGLAGDNGENAGFTLAAAGGTVLFFIARH